MIKFHVAASPETILKRMRRCASVVPKKFDTNKDLITPQRWTGKLYSASLEAFQTTEMLVSLKWRINNGILIGNVNADLCR